MGIRKLALREGAVKGHPFLEGFEKVVSLKRKRKAVFSYLASGQDIYQPLIEKAKDKKHSWKRATKKAILTKEHDELFYSNAISQGFCNFLKEKGNESLHRFAEMHKEENLFEIKKALDDCELAGEEKIKFAKLLAKAYTDNLRYSIRDFAAISFDVFFKTIIWLIIVAYCVSLIYLPFWMVITSFRDYYDYNLDPMGFKGQYTFENYADALKSLYVDVNGTNGQIIRYDFFSLAGFSIIFSVFNSFWANFLTTCVAYVIAKYKFPGRNLLFNLGIVIMIVPIIGSGAAGLQYAKMMGTYDNMFMLILLGPSAVFSGMNFLLLYGAFKAMPWDYAESIFIDGGGHLRAMFSAYFPMILPTFAVLYVLSFLGNWNNYNTFMIYLPSTPNLAYGLYKFQNAASAGASRANVTTIMAGFTIVVIPTIILYFASQKLILAKFNVGGLKG